MCVIRIQFRDKSFMTRVYKGNINITLSLKPYVVDKVKIISCKIAQQTTSIRRTLEEYLVLYHN